MAKNSIWHDEYWLLLLQQFLKRPVGVKPLYSRGMVDLSLELHIAPQALQARMLQLEHKETSRLVKLWETYGENTKRLSLAVKQLRAMKGFGSAFKFYDGVEVQETFEKDFRPLSEDPQLSPLMLTLILDLYFQLTPATMVSNTPEIQQLARLMKLPANKVVEVLLNGWHKILRTLRTMCLLVMMQANA